MSHSSIEMRVTRKAGLIATCARHFQAADLIHGVVYIYTALATLQMLVEMPLLYNEKK